MNCDEARARVIDALESAGTTPPEEDVRRHLETCASCRMEMNDLSRVWEQLGALETPQLESTAASHMMQRLLWVERGNGSGRSRIRRGILAVAALLIAAFGGALVSRSAPVIRAFPLQGAAAPSEPGTNVANDNDLYLFLLHRPTQPLPPNRGPRYQEWADNLRERNQLIRAEGLQATTGWLLSGPATAMTATPLPAPVGDVEGFFLITARDSTDLIEAARISPHFDYGGVIEVRRVVN